MFVGIGEARLRGRGYGTEACRLICEYGFFFRNLYSTKVEVHGYNHTALRLCERLGFKVVGHLRGANLLNNRHYDEIIMDLVRSEFELKHVARFEDLESAR
jgi:RimJ/RimL family protein N-acetyltransferase